MFLVRFFVYWPCFIRLVSSFINSSLLQEISIGKPVAIDPANYEMHIIHPTKNTSVRCTTLLVSAKGKPEYFVDFENSYPVIQFSIASIMKSAKAINIFLDKKSCLNYTAEPGSYKTVTSSCVRISQGRMFSVKSQDSFHLCSLSVYTCRAGLSGPKCEAPCPKGTYGVGCVLSCKCRDSEGCNAVTGECPTGCQNILSDSNYGCMVRKPDISSYMDMLRITTTPVMNISSSSPSLDLDYLTLTKTDANEVQLQNENFTSSNCLTLTTNTSRLTVTITYVFPVTLQGIIIQHRVNFPFPYHLILATDGVSCRTLTNVTDNLAGTKKIMCHRKGIKGTKIKISYVKSEMSQLDNYSSVDICRITVLECSKGFYGPRCRISCNCMSTGCDAFSGVCLRGLCYQHYRGKNCASFNIAHNRSFKVKFYSLKHTSQEGGVPPYLLDFFFKEPWHSWWYVEMDEIYDVNSLSLLVQTNNDVGHVHFVLYPYTGILTDVHFDKSEFFWSGFPCNHLQRQIEQPFDLQCSFKAKTIVIVVQATNFPSYFAITDIKIWSCADGTFGYHCEGVCHCKDELETCDKITGHCRSGCADGYKPINGQSCVWGGLMATERCHCAKGLCPHGSSECVDGCQPGWMGLYCNISCPTRRYGLDCLNWCNGCHIGPQNLTCIPSTGDCIYGCREDQICPDNLGLSRPNDSSSMAYSTKVTIITLVVCAVLILFGGFICKFFWMKMNKDEEDIYKLKELTIKRDVSKEVNEQILRDHMDFHENFLKRDYLNKSQRGDRVDNLPEVDNMDEVRKNTFDLKKSSAPKPPAELKLAGQGKPLGQDHEQQDADVKVALWVLSQNFDEFIQRRKERLANYQGNILDIQESTYSIPKVDIEGDIHDLYDEIAPLELP